jgi:hypothetical protein
MAKTTSPDKLPGYKAPAIHKAFCLLREGALVQGPEGHKLYLGPALVDLAFSNWNYRNSSILVKVSFRIKDCLIARRGRTLSAEVRIDKLQPVVLRNACGRILPGVNEAPVQLNDQMRIVLSKTLDKIAKAAMGGHLFRSIINRYFYQLRVPIRMIT